VEKSRFHDENDPLVQGHRRHHVRRSSEEKMIMPI